MLEADHPTMVERDRIRARLEVREEIAQGVWHGRVRTEGNSDDERDEQSYRDESLLQERGTNTRTANAITRYGSG